MDLINAKQEMEKGNEGSIKPNEYGRVVCRRIRQGKDRIQKIKSNAVNMTKAKYVYIMHTREQS